LVLDLSFRWSALRRLYQAVLMVKRWRPDLLQGWMYHGNLFASVLHAGLMFSPQLLWNIRCTGNPDLKFETAWGVDIGLEQRLPRGVVGINFFYRRVNNLIALVNTGIPTDPEADPDSEEGRARFYTFENVGKGKVYGIEFDLSAPLSFIGLDNTGVFANFTRLWSKRTEPNTELRVPFDGQPKYVYNVGLTQDFPTIGASAGFSYRKQGESISTFLGEEEHQFYGGNLEAYVEKRIGKNFVLRLSGTNLLDARSLQYERNFDGDTGLDIIEAQRAGDVDNFEVEHEETSRQIMLTLRAVF
jgi:outer membrane receptor protein involved in Fe transport